MEGLREGLAFDDVLLVPKRSSVMSRRDVDLRAKISRNITINVPAISLDMSTVTEAGMATAMARAGGLGIIHRFMTIKEEVEEVLKVKRAENLVIDEPITISPEAAVRDALETAHKIGVYSFIVVNQENKLLGIVTSRNIKFESDKGKKLSEIMTPREKLIVGRPETTLEQAKEVFRKFSIEKLPLVDAADRLVGLITAKDLTNRLNPLAVRDKKGRLVVGAAVGIRGDYLERAEAAIKAGADLICVDVAHGHLEVSLDAVSRLREKFPGTDLMAGNIATEEGARDIAAAGADSIRVGIGNGTICKTRLVAGSGVPQFTAITWAKKGAGNVPIIADGGMRQPGDFVKAIAAGASAGMFGSLFAGTDESPGEIVMWNGRRSKLYRGSASLSQHIDRKKTEESGSEEVLGDYVSEGADQVTVPYKGSVAEVVVQLAGGLRSGMSYVGARTIEELWKRAEFVRITPAGLKESGIHDVEQV
ncbi:MAG: IMP dehydrogenase [DPANN group archaeon]|nr:IMP dehydrogenase [DPANN group archaeon]